jgi:phospholipase C
MRFPSAASLVLAGALLASCGGGGSGAQPSSPFAVPQGNTARASSLLRGVASAKITHIVIIFQENRTPDYLFQGVPGADIATTALDSEGQTVTLQPISLAAPYDLSHGRGAFVDDYDGGKMDGFDKNLPLKYHLRPYGYAPASEVKPYFRMATKYVFADRMFQTNQSGSFPAHQYMVSGTSSALPNTTDDASSNGINQKHPTQGAPVGCDAPKRSVVETVNPSNGKDGPDEFPCFERPVLSDLLDAKGVSWRYYQHDLGVGLWHALDAIQHVRYGPDYANVISPSQVVLTDISQGRLAGMSWVMPPSDAYSDHSGSRSSKGPAWVTAIVNAIGQSKYWDSTAIIITWDDWGGWYDHVPPQIFNGYELGFRVPLIVVSPYAKKGYVSHVQHEFGSILKFTEETFNLGSLHTTDDRSDDLMDAFDFTQNPRTFVPIKAPPFHPGNDTLAGSPDVEDP